MFLSTRTTPDLGVFSSCYSVALKQKLVSRRNLRRFFHYNFRSDISYFGPQRPPHPHPRRRPSLCVLPIFLWCVSCGCCVGAVGVVQTCRRVNLTVSPSPPGRRRRYRILLVDRFQRQLTVVVAFLGSAKGCFLPTTVG